MMRAAWLLSMALCAWLCTLSAQATGHAAGIDNAERAIARGDYGAALKALEPELKKHKPRAYALRGRIHQLRGEKDAAERDYMQLIELYNNDKIRDTDADGLWAVAEAAQGLGAFRDANESFARATQADPKNLDIEVAWADLFLEKYDAGHAEVGLARVLEANPNHARALERMARVRLEQGAPFREVEALLDRALASDPKLSPAFVTRAGIALRDGDLVAADRELDRALAANPHDLEALSVRASVRFLADDPQGFARAEKRVLEENPRFSRMYSIISTYTEWEHRYDDLVKLSDKALAIDADDALAHATRGLNLLRLGREREGLAALEAAWSRDRYNVLVFNTLNLYEDVIAKEYESFDRGPFHIRMHKDEKAILAPYAGPLLERAYADMNERYHFTPEGPISIELYAREEHFSVRTSGLPHIGVQGVCFGKVLTALSPRGGEFNWGQILWHELSHVFHVQLSKSRVPRWFTEGLAEYETMRARPEWKREDDRALWDALEAGQLPALTTLNHAFTHARSGEELMVAYYASSLAVGYLVERFGFDVVPKMLSLWGASVPTEQVFQRALGVDLAALDQAFRAHLKSKLGPRYEQDFRVDVSQYRDLAALKRRGEGEGAKPGDKAALALGLAVHGEALGAEQLASQVIAQHPTEPVALFTLAHLALVRGDLPQAVTRLRALISAGHDGYQVRMLLARSEHKLKHLEQAMKELAAAMRLDPERGEAYELAAQVADERKDQAGLEQALNKLSFLDQHARAPLARLLDVLAAREAYPELLQRAEAGLYLDPERAELHRLLAVALLHQKGPREAQVEAERALTLASDDDERAKARATLASIRAASGKAPAPQPGARPAPKPRPQRAPAGP